MKKQFVALLFLFFCTAVVYAKDSALLVAVENSARAWLVLNDNSQYAESWRTASPQFKSQQSEPEWLKSIQSTRTRLGAIEARYIAAAGYTKAPSGFTDGDYILIQFYVTFVGGGLASENVTLTKNSSETWQVAEYEIE